MEVTTPKHSRGCDQWESLSSSSSCCTSMGSSSSSEAACDDADVVSDVCSDDGDVDGDGFSSASDLYVAVIVSIEPSHSHSSSSGSSWRQRPRRRHSTENHKGSSTTTTADISGCAIDSSLAIEHSSPPATCTRALLFFATKQPAPAKPPRGTQTTHLELSFDGDSRLFLFVPTARSLSIY